MLAFVPVPGHPEMSGEKIKGRHESNFISKQNRPCCSNRPDKYLSSEKLRKGLASNERSHRHRVRRRAFSAAASFGIWAIANCRLDRVKQLSFLDAIFIRPAVMFGQGEPENQPVVGLGFCKLVMPRQKAA